MKLLLVRHAIAEDKVEFAHSGTSDSLRPLTAEGQGKFALMAQHLAQRFGHWDLLLTSPYTRAVQTAKILTEFVDCDEVEQWSSMTPAMPVAETVKELGKLSEKDIVLVGHDPHISELVSCLLSGTETPIVRFKKGGMLCLSFSGKIEAAQAELLWYLTPGALL